MVHRKSHRKKHNRSQKKRHSKNIINKTVNSTLSVAHKFTKSTSKKYMPKVKSGLENVGDKVIKTGTKSIPFLQSMSRKFVGMFSKNKTKKHRRH
jgi:hypothetical protein